MRARDLTAKVIQLGANTAIRVFSNTSDIMLQETLQKLLKEIPVKISIMQAVSKNNPEPIFYQGCPQK